MHFKYSPNIPVKASVVATVALVLVCSSMAKVHADSPLSKSSLASSLGKQMPGDSEYSEGLGYYIDGNYQLAQALWLKASKNNHARSMFNLGLLHDEAKIDNADSAKAQRWFKLAGEHGYGPADYRIALKMIDSRRARSDVELVLKRGSRNGSYKAASLLDKITGRSEVELAKADVDSLTGLAAIPTSRSTIASDSNSTPPPSDDAMTRSTLGSDYLSETWIATKDPASWTIQILAFNDQAKVKEFIQRHGLSERAAFFEEKNEGGTLYKLVYGSYGSKELAEQARRSLSSQLSEHGPWLRSMGGVQAVIAKQ